MPSVLTTRCRQSVLRGCGMACLIFSALLLVGCGEDPQQLLETAQFEEQQRNLTHAQELYERIIRDHPASPQAQLAKERMQALQKDGS